MMGHVILLVLAVGATVVVSSSSSDASDRHCDNAIVSAWCDTHIHVDLDCIMHPALNTYECNCVGNHALCPTECIEGASGTAVLPLSRSTSSITCGPIPVDETPNYILKEKHALNRCENNAAVAAWCDDYVNAHLECHLAPSDDTYTCHCSGKHSNCPDECIGGIAPMLKTATSVVCRGIPNDSPNYILKE